MLPQGHLGLHKISESLITGSCCCSIPCFGSTSFISCPFLTPDLSRQGRLAPVLCTPHSVWTRKPRDRDLRRSMELAFEGRGAGKANLSEQCCYWDYSTPLPGELWFPINTFLLALTFSFPGSDILFRHLRSWVAVCDCAAFFARQEAFDGASQLPLLVGICHSFREARPWSAPWLLTGNKSASCLRTSRPLILWGLILIGLCRTPLVTCSHTPMF